MNWIAVAAAGQVAGAVAIFVTLLYLARQIRLSNRQARLDAYRQTMNSLNAWARSLYESAEITDLVIRGRQSYDSLSEAERIRFANLHHVLLNTLQLDYDHVQELAPDDDYRESSEEMIRNIVRGYFNHPGVLLFWEKVQESYGPGLRKLVSDNTGDA